MTWVDGAVLAIIGISVVVSVLRGLVRELLALVSWIVAFFAARFLALDVAPIFAKTISDGTLRVLVAFIVVFVVTFLVMALVSVAMSSLVKAAGLSVLDRILGAAFGFVRGAVIVLIATLLAGLTALPRQPVWRNSWSSARLSGLAESAKVWLPYDVAKHIHY